MGNTEKVAVKEREKWGNKIEFLLSCLGYAVGLGNVWRFPYMCGRNGGAAFLIPYVLVMVFAGFPIFYMELALGQYTSLSPHLLYSRMSPLFAGIGYCMLAASVYQGIYYNMIIAWAMHYFSASFKGIFGELPWSNCNNTWNTIECFDDIKAKACESNGLRYFKGECIDQLTANSTTITSGNLTMSIAQFLNNTVKETAAQQYNKYSVLNEAAGIDGIGWPKGDLVLALLAAWFLVFLCLINGVKSSGKVVYFTALFPYVLLVILCVRGNMLDGAGDGLEFFLYPNLTTLTSVQPWVDAATQIFFSLSLGSGGLTTLASYNEFNNNLMRDTLIVVLGNAATSILAGFTIFPIIGHIAKAVYPTWSARNRVTEFAKSGTTLAFITYPDALVRLPAPWVWSLLFFFMLILLGIDGQLVTVEVLITSIVDHYPHLRKFKRKIFIVLSVCLFSFACGLILTTPIGTFVLTLVDNYAGGITLMIACLIEVLMVAYIYGHRRFVNNIKEMMGEAKTTLWKYLGYPVNPFWWICWIAITPAYLIGTLIMLVRQHEPTKMGNYIFPEWADIAGWCITLSCVMWIPGIAIYRVIAQNNYLQPTDDWGPAGGIDERAAVINRSRLSRNGVELSQFIEGRATISPCQSPSPTQLTVPFAWPAEPVDVKHFQKDEERHRMITECS